ncbi:hrp65 protein-like [Toxorhynchites rutilus septentrionalis]|uniref:hrp65 protein-like n=1 Tax=Toxorhynchites rutilus septentrionalis TaxID=329112 RepID=UPI002479904E|nr:hrp65 protein-like [Toxorhynchites rutilus septentrionalis]
MEVAKPELNGSPLPQRPPIQPNEGMPQQDGGTPMIQGSGDGEPNQPGGFNKQNQNQRQNNRNNNGNNQNRNRGNRFANRDNNQQRGGGGGGGGGGFGGFNRQNNQDGNNDGNNQQYQQRQGGQGNRGGNRRSQGGDGDQSFDRRRSGPGEQYFIQEKLRMLQGPILDIPPIEIEENKFSGRNRLYIGNLTNDVTEDELTELFKPFGDISEIFMNKEKNYAFVRVDYFGNAEKAKRDLEGTLRKGRPLRVRFAPNATAIRVKNLTAFVSNELLYKAFEVFGPLERASVQVDERGKSTGEGIVEFKNKPGAMAALRYCNEKCYFLCSSLRPCIVEPYTHQDDADGLPEKSLNKRIPDFMKSRQMGPRFAEPGSFEHEYGQRWKQMNELFKQRAEALKREMVMEEEKLEAQMELARYEHETEQLREQLRMREQGRDRQKAEWEMKERQAQESLMRNVPDLQNNQALNNSQDNNEGRRPFDNMNKSATEGGNNMGMEVRDYEHGQNRPPRFNDEEGQQLPNQQGGGGNNGPQQQRQGNAFGGGGGGNNRNWMNNNNDRRQSDDFQSKRRRF